MGAHFAWITSSATVAKYHMKAPLDDQGCTPESTVAVLAVGADGLSSVVRAMTSAAVCLFRRRTLLQVGERLQSRGVRRRYGL